MNAEYRPDKFAECTLTDDHSGPLKDIHLYQVLGRIEGKLDGQNKAMEKHFADDDNRFKEAAKLIEKTNIALTAKIDADDDKLKAIHERINKIASKQAWLFGAGGGFGAAIAVGWEFMKQFLQTGSKP